MVYLNVTKMDEEKEKLQKENKELKDKIHILELIKSDWIDSQLTDKKFPEGYIQGKKEIKKLRDYYERQLREQQQMLSVATDKYFKLLKECNEKFETIQKLKSEVSLLSSHD